MNTVLNIRLLAWYITALSTTNLRTVHNSHINADCG